MDAVSLFSSTVLRLRPQSVEAHGEEAEALGEAQLLLGPDEGHAGLAEEGAELVVGAGDAAVELVVDVLAGRDVLLDDDDARRGQRPFTALQVLDELRVRQVAHAPLVPDEVVLLLGHPALQARHVDVAHFAFFLERALAHDARELLDGLDDIHHLAGLAEKTFRDAPDARAAVDAPRQLRARGGHDAGQQAAQPGQEGRGAAQVDARDLGEAAQHAIDVGVDRVPVAQRRGVVDVRVGGVVGHGAVALVWQRGWTGCNAGREKEKRKEKEGLERAGVSDRRGGAFPRPVDKLPSPPKHPLKLVAVSPGLGFFSPYIYRYMSSLAPLFSRWCCRGPGFRQVSFTTLASPLRTPCRSVHSMSDLFVELTAPNGRKYTQPLGLFIDNEFVRSKSGEKIATINPT